MKLVNDFDGTGYAEEGQAHPFKMILCKREGDNFVALHNWIKCRDFVAEALFSELSGTAKRIYGFGWKHNIEEKPLTKAKRLYMAVKATEKDIESLETNLHILHSLEDMMCVGNSTKRTCIHFPTVCATTPNTQVVLSSPTPWRCSPTLLNFYTLIVKSLMFGIHGDNLEGLVKGILESKDDTFTREQAYWKTITKYGFTPIYSMLTNCYDVFSIDWESYADVNTNSLHHGHGPVSFFQAIDWYVGGDKEVEGACPVIRDSVKKVCEMAAV